MKQRCSESPTLAGSNAYAPRTVGSSVQTLPADRSDHTLADRVGLGALRTAIARPPSQGSDRTIEAFCEDPVPIVIMVLVLVLVAGRLSQLLQSPARARVCP